MRQILTLILILSGLTNIYSQAPYKVSNNQKLLLALSADHIPEDEARTAADKFFGLASQENRKEWEKTLSQDFFDENGQPKEKLDRLWQRLTLQTEHYLFLKEIPAVKTNQKTYIFSSKQLNRKNTEKTIVLIDEHGKWKVFSMK
jgi:hypothetical protein